MKVADWPTFNKFEEFVIEHQLLRHKVASLLVTKYMGGKAVPAWMLFGGALCNPQSPLYDYSFQPVTKRLPLQVCSGNWLERGDIVRPKPKSENAKDEIDNQRLEIQWAKFKKPFDPFVNLTESRSKFDVLTSSSFAIWLSNNNIFDGILEESIIDKSGQRSAWFWIDTKFSELGLNSTISEDKDWKDLLAKLEGLKEKVPDREHILMIVSNRKISQALIEKVDNKSVLLVSRTGDRLQWLLSPACARLYVYDQTQ